MRSGVNETETDVPRSSTGTNVIRGSIVLAAAVLVGAFLFAQINDSGPIAVSADQAAETVSTTAPDPASASADGTDDGTTVSDATMTDDATGSGQGSSMGDDSTDSMSDGSTDSMSDSDGETTSDSAPGDAMATGREPSEVSVLVLNAADQQGIAAQGTEKATNAGYNTMVAKNATDKQGSAIYYIGDFEQEALALADVYGPELQTLVEPLNTDNAPTDDYTGADVIVVLGTDGLIPVG